MKSYRGRSPIADDNDHLSQDIGQESNIINLDSNLFDLTSRLQWACRDNDEDRPKNGSCLSQKEAPPLYEIFWLPIFSPNELDKMRYFQSENLQRLYFESVQDNPLLT